MMKFGKKLETEAVEAWKLHYIDYGQLKRFLKLLLTEEIDSKVRESKFKVDLEKQRVQASTFYAQHKHILQTNLQLLLKSRSKLQSSRNVNKLDQIESLIISFRTFSDELRELKKFADLNVEGFQKILKKFDKWNKSQLRQFYMTNILANEPFYQQTEIKEMKQIQDKEIKELENLRSQSLVLNVEIDEILKSPEIYESQIENLLYSCVVAGKLATVKNIIEKGNIIHKDEFERTLLHVSHPDCLEFLLEYSLKTNQLLSLSKIQDTHKKLVLHIFAEKGFSSALNFLLSNIGTENIDSVDNISNSPLLLACNKGNAECVKILLKYGANIKAVDSYGNTGLHLAAKLGNKATLENLLENNNCPINQVNVEKQTALHLATLHRHQDCVDLLLNHNAQDSQDEEGFTCLHFASSNGDASTLQLLINACKNISDLVNTQNLDGYTPLHCAAQENRMNVVDILLNAGAKVDIVDNDGWTAEAYAAYIGNIPLADKVKSSNPIVPESFPQSAPLTKSKSPIFPDSPPDARNNQQKNLQELLCRVEFKVTAVTALGQYVAVVGDRKVLGSWEPLKSLPLTPTTPPTSSVAIETTWTGHVYLPVRVATKYRYIIMEGSQILKWETLPSPRVLRPRGKTYIAEDGTFGVDPQSPIPAQYVDEGWLIDESQIRIRFRPDSGLVLYENLPHLRVLLSTKEPYNLIDTIEFPLSQEDRDWVVQGRFSPDKLTTLQYDVYSKNVLIGRAIVHPSLMKALKGHVIVPVINTQLNIVGEISFHYLVVTPFSHPDLSKALRDTFWKSTSLIGHRGGGADSSSKIGAFHRTHIQENTLLSFVTASSLGAEYVEFDVQLTKDNVPIIYHNWIIPDPQSSSNIEVPIGEITLKQLKSLRAKKLAVQKRFGRSRSNSLSELSRNSSGEDVTQIPIENSGHNGEGAFIEDAFPTLEECFKKIPIKTGFNIEMKYPLPENVKDYGLFAIPERNDYCNRILDLVFTYAQDRKIMFSSFDPDICTLLSLKQPRYPVFFLTHSGTPQYKDPRCNSIREAVQFAKANKLTGIVAESKPLIRCPQLITVTKKSGLLLATYGVLNNQAECAQLQEQLGVDAIIVDHVAYVNKHLKV